MASFLDRAGRGRKRGGEALLTRLSDDLTSRSGRGSPVSGLQTARLFYLAYAAPSISATASRKSRAGNPQVGVILCTSKADAVARYALEGLPNKVLAAEYRTALPKEQLIAKTLSRTRHELEARTSRKGRPARQRK
jgi:hypothetical protein